MGRIYRAAPSAAARANNYRWQDDPNTGEFSEYGRGSHVLPVLALLIGAAVGMALLATAFWMVLR